MKQGFRAIDGNTVVISLDRAAAVDAADRHLRAGRSVAMLVSNVPVADETRLKAIARSTGAWLVSPHCLGHAVRAGCIGLVGTAGTGIQETMCQIDRLGGGVSHAFSFGARDLSLDLDEPEVFRAIRFLLTDPTTDVLILMVKTIPASRRAALETLLAEAHKPIFVCSLDRSYPRSTQPRLFSTFEQVARAAVAATGVETSTVESDLGVVALSERSRLAPNQRWVRGLFSGGSVCQEATGVLRQVGLQTESNGEGSRKYKMRQAVSGHVCWDTGLPPFTGADPTYHPMTTFGPRQLRMARDVADPGTAVVLFDVVLGFGSHPSLADVISPAVAGFRRALAREGRQVAFVAAVVGTDSDPQDRGAQVAQLTEAGVIVAQSTSQAARLAAEISMLP